VLVQGDSDVFTKLAKCCLPLPSDEIVGFVTRGDGISVHRKDCPNAEALATTQPDRMVAVAWDADAEGSVFLVSIQIEGLDRAGMLSDITRTLGEQHVNIVTASISAGRDQLFKGRLTFESPDPTHLSHVLESIRRVPGIFDVSRVNA